MRSPSGRPIFRSPLLLATAGLVVFSTCSGAGASTPPHVVRAAAVSGGLVVSVRATESATSGTVRVVVVATAAHARGAIGYDISYGDGTSARDVLPQFCLAGHGGTRHARWRFTHHYAPGTYEMTVTMHVTCAPGHVTTRLTLHAA